LKKYYKTLLEWNEKINLISRKEENVLEKHFLDSIIFLPEIESLINQPHMILDIGSGGGFPAIILAIMKPEWDFTLCESTTKKANFLNVLINELGLKNTEIINARVEEIGKGGFQTRPNKKKYDLITARAIAKLDELIKYAMPLLKKEGCLICYKAKDIDEELKHAEKIIQKTCKGKVTLPLTIFSKEINGVERKLVIMHVEA